MRCTLALLATILVASGCSPPGARSPLDIYCGRSEALVGPAIERFREQTGIEVNVRYGGTAEMAALILEQGDESPADVYYGQDAGALGALAKRSRLRELPRRILEKVEPRFRARDGRWVGTSGRARVLAYNTDRLSEADLPSSVHALTAPRWKDRVGWAPANGSFQAFVTAMRRIEGDEATRRWLEAMLLNGAKSFPDNTELFQALLNGEIVIGLTNHYYLFRFREQPGEVPARNYNPSSGGAGALVNVAGAGVLDTAAEPELGMAFIEFLLSEETQRDFARRTYEYPLVRGVPIHPLVKPLSEIATPEVDLSDLDDLTETLELLHEVGAL